MKSVFGRQPYTGRFRTMKRIVLEEIVQTQGVEVDLNMVRSLI